MIELVTLGFEALVRMGEDLSGGWLLEMTTFGQENGRRWYYEFEAAIPSGHGDVEVRVNRG